MATVNDDAVPVCYYEEIDGHPGSVKMVRADLVTLDEKSNRAAVLVHYPDRRVNKTEVPYKPGKPGCWGYQNDK